MHVFQDFMVMNPRRRNTIIEKTSKTKLLKKKQMKQDKQEAYTCICIVCQRFSSALTNHAVYGQRWDNAGNSMVFESYSEHEIRGS